MVFTARQQAGADTAKAKKRSKLDESGRHRYRRALSRPSNSGIQRMARICELTGKGRQVGHNVSHANNKTKRTFLPNLQNVTLLSDRLGKGVKLRVSTHGLRSVEHVGGLDNWLMKAKSETLSLRARRLKREIEKALAA